MTNPWPYLFWSLRLLVYLRVCHTMVCHARMFPLHLYFSQNHVTHNLSPLYPLFISIHDSLQTKIGALTLIVCNAYQSVLFSKILNYTQIFQWYLLFYVIDLFHLNLFIYASNGTTYVFQEKNQRHVRMNNIAEKNKNVRTYYWRHNLKLRSNASFILLLMVMIVHKHNACYLISPCPNPPRVVPGI